jgi:hypothetical protein
MQFGAMNFRVKPVLDEIETFARLGSDYLELAMDPPMVHHSTLATLRTKITLEVFDANRRMLVDSRERIRAMVAGG